ncbi:MAG: RsmE family RNA methyltransferase [Candidatus Omnitrophota bacterium]|nr:RsmE family RNA methyltransferase [Candidatus Omnitrophota bacterium]
MHRFFCTTSDITSTEIIIKDKEQAHHIRDVLRLKPGKQVEVFDEKGNEYSCEIREIKDKIYLEIKNKIAADKISQRIKLTVACALPKKSKLDDIIDKLVQLGVHRIIPLKTERVIVKLDKYKEAGRLERWRKIALSAAKQSKRNDLPVIEPVQDLQKVIARSQEFDLKLIPYLGGERKNLKDVLDKFLKKGDGSIFSASDSRKIEPSPCFLILIGPEGDFSEAEVKLAVAAGFIPVTLGDLVLRVDTAAIAAASFITMYTS